MFGGLALCGLLVSASFLAAWAAHASEAHGEGTRLSPGAVVEREQKAGEAHRYEIDLPEGEYFQAVVEQRGVDVSLSLIDPAGRTVLELDGPTADDGPEPVAFVAGASGVHQLVVQAGGSVSWPGGYEIRVEAWRTPGRRSSARGRRSRHVGGVPAGRQHRGESQASSRGT